MPFLRCFTLFFALALLAAPGSARVRRRTVRHRTAHRRVIRSSSIRRPAPIPVPRPAIQSVRSIALFVVCGFDGSDWNAVRAAKADGYTAWDRMPVSGVALAPSSGLFSPDTTAGYLATGRDKPVEPPQATLAERAKAAGKSVALVGSGDITDALPAYLALAPNGETGARTLSRLAANRFDALFARTAPADMVPPIDTLGYQLLTDPHAVMMAETVPVLGTAPTEAVPFDTLAFRALHLAARNPRGFLMLVGARKSEVPPDEVNAAANAVLNYARKDKRTLVLIALCSASGECVLYADGASARKFGGTMMLTDVPQIVAGVAAIKAMPRDFSPLYFPRLAPKAVVAPRKGIVPLPW